MNEFFLWLITGNGVKAFFKSSFFVLVIVIVFLIIREIITWFYKINRIVELLESINRKLDMSIETKVYYNVQAPVAAKESGDGEGASDNSESSQVGWSQSSTNSLDSMGKYNDSNMKQEVHIVERIKGILTKEYRFRDLFSK